MKKIRVVAIVLIVLVGGLLVGKNVIANLAVTGGVRAMTGLGLKIRHMDVGLMSTHLGVEGLRVLNPSGFSDPLMADLPEIYVDYDLGAFLKGIVHLKEVRLHLKELTVVKNQQGAVNLNAVQAVKASKEKTQVPRERAPAAARPASLRIDALELNIGSVVYKDYSSGMPQVRTFRVDIHERFRNVNDPRLLAGLIITRALAKTTVSSLAHLDLRAVESDVTSLLRSSLSQVDGIGKEALGSAEEAVKGTAGALKKLLGQ